MRPTLRRARPAIPWLAEIVASADAQRAWPVTLRQTRDFGAQVVQQPVTPGPHGRIRVLHDHCEAPRLRRRTDPFEGRRKVGALTGMQFGNPGALCEGTGKDLKRHEDPALIVAQACLMDETD